MKVLGIETSCDETAAAVVEGRKVLSSVVLSQVDLHAKYGGIVPEVASRNHAKAILPVVKEALESAGTGLGNLDAIAVTNGPGLIGSLIVGVQFAKGLARSLGKPLIGVNHVHAHLAAAMLIEDPPEPPFVGLAVSGGHTSLYLVERYDKFVMLGRTRDDAAGEALDKAGVMLGLPYPGGVYIDRVGRNGDPNFYRFPRPMLKSDSLDFSFSGLKTALREYLKELKRPLDEKLVADLSASYLQAVVDVLVQKTVRAARRVGVKRIVIGGGVAANSVLRRDLQREGELAGMRLYLIPRNLCTDNGAMVAALGGYMLEHGSDAPRDLEVSPYPKILVR